MLSKSTPFPLQNNIVPHNKYYYKHGCKYAYVMHDVAASCINSIFLNDSWIGFWNEKTSSLIVVDDELNKFW